MQQVRDIVLHPKYPNSGNNFVVIVDFNNQVHCCKAQFHPVERPGDATQSVLDFVKRLPEEGECEIDVTASSDNGLIVAQTITDSSGSHHLRHYEYPRA